MSLADARTSPGRRTAPATDQRPGGDARALGGLDHAAGRHPVRRYAVHRIAVERPVAGIGLVESGHEIEEGRLASARGRDREEVPRGRPLAGQVGVESLLLPGAQGAGGVVRTGGGMYYVRDIGNAVFDTVRNAPFTIRRDDLSFIGPNNKPVVEPGEFDVAIGGLTQRFTLK